MGVKVGTVLELPTTTTTTTQSPTSTTTTTTTQAPTSTTTTTTTTHAPIQVPTVVPFTNYIIPINGLIEGTHYDVYCATNDVNEHVLSQMVQVTTTGFTGGNPLIISNITDTSLKVNATTANGVGITCGVFKNNVEITSPADVLSTTHYGINQSRVVTSGMADF